VSFSISSSNPRRFVIAVLLLLAILLGLTVLAREVLVRTGDFMAEADIVRFQREAGKPCMFSEYGKQNEALYKFELYRATKPEIIALGSSRVLELNARQFSVPFVNLGRVMTDIKRGDSAVEELLKIHKPKFMLIGLDQYWFNPNWSEAGVAKVKLTPSDPNDPRAIMRLLGLVVSEGLWSEVWRALQQGPECQLGISAKRYLSGYAADGYRYYGHMLTSGEEAEDKNLKMTLGRIKDGTRRFERGATVSQSQFEFLLQMHARLEREAVPHLFYFPAFSPTAQKVMSEDGGYGYLTALTEKLKTSGLPFAEANDPALADCDFLDGFHLGDAAQARALGLLAQTDSRLHPFVNKTEVDRMSEPGMKPLQYLTEDFGLKFTDFLDLGCPW
jgi:hypothetical protein